MGHPLVNLKTDLKQIFAFSIIRLFLLFQLLGDGLSHEAGLVCV